jgi:hypothetical protein
MTLEEARRFAHNGLVILPTSGNVTNCEGAEGWLWPRRAHRPVYSVYQHGRWYVGGAPNRRINDRKLARIIASDAWKPVRIEAPLKLLADALGEGIEG